MKVYGNENTKRLAYICGYSKDDLNNPTTPIGWINKNGDIENFIAGRYRVQKTTYCDDRFMEFESYEYNGNTYWFGERSSNLNNDVIEWYMELPMVINDKNFRWKKNKKYGSMECIIEDKAFEYHCIYKADGNAIVNVKYNACDNLHRNRVTIATIEIEYASNEVILKAIKEWKREFKEMISCA